MRKLALISILAFTSVFAINLTGSSNNVTRVQDCKYGQCSKYKSNGERCQNCCQENSTTCWSHR